MKIVLLTGSPHRSGTTSVLAEQFAAGAQAKGHEIFRFDAAFKNTHPCLGCDVCGMNGPCVHKDDIENELIMRLTGADLIALVSPVYYFHITAQLKTVVDRFYARSGRISDKQAVLLAAAGSDNDLTMRSLRVFYATLCRYMRWQSRGMVLAPGCATKEQIARTAFPKQAYDLGLSL